MDVKRLFPVDSPIRPEERLIGRAQTVDALTRQVADRFQHTLLFAPRRVGKTSLALATLDRVRAANQGWAIETDLSLGPMTDPGDLADRIASQARTAGIKIPKAEGLKRALGKARSVPAHVKAAAASFGLDDVEDLADVVDQALAPVDELSRGDLRDVFRALEVAAAATDRFVVVLLDEVQRLGKWKDAEKTIEVLAQVVERADGRVVLLFAGSEESAIDALFGEGSALYHDGLRFEVPEISYEDWLTGLKERFAEAGIELDQKFIFQIVDASEGHPQKTMRICAEILRWADEGGTKTPDELIVGNAIRTAQEHPSWN